MAKDSKGRKFNRIPAHNRTLSNGTIVYVKEHIRSNRKDSSGVK